MHQLNGERQNTHVVLRINVMEHAGNKLIIKKREATEIQTTTHWDLIGRSMTVPPLVSLPSSVLPTHSSHCAFIPQGKVQREFQIVFYLIIFLLKSSSSLKLTNSGSVCTVKDMSETAWPCSDSTQ
jgi:hypothetical protein